MTVATVGREGSTGVRAGAHALSLLAVPLNVHLLQALVDGPRPLADLRRAAGSPPQTTMRGHLRALADAEIVDGRRHREFPRPADYELGPAGRDLLVVADALEAWLAAAPDTPLRLGMPAAKSAIRALVEGWVTNMLRVLAARPLSLTELDRVISTVTYPSLERRLTAMRLTGQLEASPGAGRSTPYVVTPWLRHVVVPLAAAIQWERRNGGASCKPLGRLDAETLFLLLAPLLRIEPGSSGSCRLVMEMGRGGDQPFSGAVVTFDDGRVTEVVARLEGSPDASIVASPAAWCAKIAEDEGGPFEFGGDHALARSVLDSFPRAPSSHDFEPAF